MSPTHAPQPCLEVGCDNLVARGRCPECELLAEPSHYDRNRGGARERGYDRAWELRRRRHLAGEPFCRRCGPGRLGKEVDHVIPHRQVRWLFDLDGNLQTLCKKHHSEKTALERTIPIGIMYPLNLPEPPHARPTLLLCGPSIRGQRDRTRLEATDVLVSTPGHRRVIYRRDDDVERNRILARELRIATASRLVLYTPAPRTAERAFWSRVLDVEAELVPPPLEWVVDAHPSGWWADYMLDQRAEEAIEARGE